MIEDSTFCSNSFLMFRSLIDENKMFKGGAIPRIFHPEAPFYDIKTVDDVEAAIKDYIDSALSRGNKIALMLSGGIDSAILAKYVPRGTKAYTFRSSLPGTIDESRQASIYAEVNGLDHEIIDVEWSDYLETSPMLMKRQGYPIHSIAPQIYKAANKARREGYTELLFGENADCLFGGQDGLFSVRRTTDEFMIRYSYVDPAMVLKDGYIIRKPFEKYTDIQGYVNVQKFMEDFYLKESTYSYVNACDAAGVKFLSPYNKMRLSIKLDINRIKSGQNKYMLRELFERLYPDLGQPIKIPMPRAVDQYLKDWSGPTRPEFRNDIDIDQLSGDQKWMIYALEWYLGLINMPPEQDKVK